MTRVRTRTRRSRRKATAFDGVLANLANMPQLIEDVAPRVAEIIDTFMRGILSAGTDAYGIPWEPRKDTGRRALPNAVRGLDKVKYDPARGGIRVRISGIYARHHWGQVRGGVKRPMLPMRGLPPDLSKQIAKAIAESLAKAVVS